MSWFAVISIALLVVQTGYSAYNAYQMRKKAQKEAADTPSPIPYITQSDVIPVVFGTVAITGPAVVEAIGPRRNEREVVNERLGRVVPSRFWEWNFVRMVLCHGQVDAVLIYADEKFETTLGADIDFDFKYGDDDRHHVRGHLRRGGLGQPVAPLVPTLPDLNWQGGALRHPGICYLLLTFWRWKQGWDQKPQFPDSLGFYVRRINWRHGQSGTTGWTDAAQWQPALAQIAPDDPAIFPQMNPAHMLRELLTDRVWGMGLPEADIDETSFAASAQTLFDEKFGLSFIWAQESSAIDFALEILRHIDGVMFQEPSTGLYTLRLIREDSNAFFDFTGQPHIVVAPPELTRRSYSELVTRVSVIYRQVWAFTVRTDDAMTTVHDLALTSQLGDIPVTLRYDGVYDVTLAHRIATRDLKRLSTPLASVRMAVTWSAGKDIRAGDRIKWSWAPYGITTIYLRVVSVTIGEIDATSVSLECVEDIYAPAEAFYNTPSPSDFVGPDYTPEPTTHLAVETPIALNGLVGATIGQNETRSTVMVMAGLPALRASLHTAWTLVTGGEFRESDLRFAGVFTLGADMSFSGLGLGTVNNRTIAADFDVDITVNYLCVLRRPDGTDEFVVVDPVSTTNANISRGVYDTTVYYGTVPTGTKMYVVGTSGATAPTVEMASSDGRVYVPATVVDTQALTQTTAELLDVTLAPTVSVTTANRQILPTCPGYTQATFDVAVGTTITWRGRNRLTAPTCTQLSVDVPPEDGTTFRLRIEGKSTFTGSVFVDVPGSPLTLASSATSYLYTKEQEDLDHKTFGGAGNFTELRLILYTVRDGYISWQRQIRVRT